MKKYILVLFISFAVLQLNAQSWKFGGQGSTKSGAGAEGLGVSMDAVHNFYLGGYYKGTFNFGSDSVTSVNWAPYMAKFNAAGKAEWVISSASTTGNNSGGGGAVATDPFGNVYLACSMIGTVKMGTAVLNYPIYDIYSDGVFIAKYDSNGHFKWAKQATGGSNYYDNMTGLQTDALGNVYACGTFTDSIIFGNIKLKTNSGATVNNSYLVKFDSAGNALWGRNGTVHVDGSGTSGCQIAMDGPNIYLTGYFLSHAAFGSDTLTMLGTNAFLVKYDTAGNVIWATQPSFVQGANYCYSQGVAVDGAGNVYIAGHFNGTVNFGASKVTNPYPAPFIAKYDMNGNARWVEAGTYNDANYQWSAYSVAADHFGHEYLECSEYPTYNPNAIKFGTTTYSCTGATDGMLLVEFDSLGNLMCGQMVASGGDDNSQVISDATGQYVYFGGDLETQVTFGSTALGPSASSGAEFPFVAAWGNCDLTTGINNESNTTATTVLFPNPNRGEFNLQLGITNSKSEIEVYNMVGEKVYSEALRQAQGDNKIDITDQPAGIYLYRVVSESGNLIGSGKFVIEK